MKEDGTPDKRVGTGRMCFHGNRSEAQLLTSTQSSLRARSTPLKLESRVVRLEGLLEDLLEDLTAAAGAAVLVNSLMARSGTCFSPYQSAVLCIMVANLFDSPVEAGKKGGSS